MVATSVWWFLPTPEFRSTCSPKIKSLKTISKFLPSFPPLHKGKMPEAIPPILSPYLDHTLSHPSLTLVTSTLSTPAHWVLLRYLYAALSEDGRRDRHSHSQSSEHESHRPVILVSLLRPRDLWLELGKKIVSSSTSITLTEC